MATHADVSFLSDYNKFVEARVYQDKAGDFSVRKVSINKNEYELKTECRKNKVLDIINRYVNLEEKFYSLKHNID